MPNSTEDRNITIATTKWNEEASVLALVGELTTQYRQASREFDLDARWNHKWAIRGKQNLHADRGRTADTFATIANPRRRPRIVFNELLPFVLSRVGNLGADEIHWEVLPNSSDIEDEQIASVASRVLRGYEDKIDLPLLAERCDLSMAVTGEAYVKVCWDPDAGERFQVEDYAADEKEFKRLYGVKPPAALGDLSIAAVSPRLIGWGPVGCEFPEAEWVLHVSERSASYVVKRWGVDPNRVPMMTADEMLYRESNTRGDGSNVPYRNREACIEYELWMRPSKDAPNGRLIVAIGDKLLVKNDDNPYEHGEIPFVQFRDVIDPEDGRGMSLVTHARGPQSDLNRNRNQQIENRELMANPFVLAQKGSLVNENEWDSAPGGIRRYTGTKPELVLGAGMPASVVVQANQTFQAMQNIFGAQDVSTSKNPAGSRSARMILALREGDATRMAPVRRRRREGWENVGRLALQVLRQYATEERSIRARVGDSDYDVMVFKGDMLDGSRPGVGYFDVRVDALGMPHSKLAQIDLIESLSKSGWLNPADPRHRKIVLQAMEMGVAEGRLDPTRSARQLAKRENQTLSSGQPVEVFEYQDHNSHLEEHEQYRNREQFERMPPEIKALFDKHVTDHLVQRIKFSMRDQAAQAQVEAELMAKQAAAGIPAMPSATNPGGQPPATAQLNGNGFPPPQNPVGVPAQPLAFGRLGATQ